MPCEGSVALLLSSVQGHCFITENTNNMGPKHNQSDVPTSSASPALTISNYFAPLAKQAAQQEVIPEEQVPSLPRAAAVSATCCLPTHHSFLGNSVPCSPLQRIGKLTRGPASSAPDSDSDSSPLAETESCGLRVSPTHTGGPLPQAAAIAFTSC